MKYRTNKTLPLWWKTDLIWYGTNDMPPSKEKNVVSDVHLSNNSDISQLFMPRIHGCS